MDTPFIFSQVYDAPIEKLWQAISRRDQMKRWYFPQLEQFEPVAGYEFKFSNDGSPYQKEWRVTKVIDGRLLAHSWTYKGYPGSSEVNFELSEEGNKTRLTLTHTGLASFPPDRHFARQRFEDGWKQILGTNLSIHLAGNKE